MATKPASLDADIDMADLASLDAPASSSGAAPSTRFRPKGKGKPKPKPKPTPEPEAKAESEPKPDSEPGPQPVAECVGTAAAPPEAGVDAMEVDGLGAGADGVGDEEEEDFVMREIDVYFTPRPFDEDTMLYVMQYPLRPCWRPYELNEICKEVRVKPWSAKVELDLNVNTESDNYDPEVSGSLRVTKQTLSSSKEADVTDYAVGVLRGNLVHLNHIDAVMQLRPSMSHLDYGLSHGEKDSGTGGQTVRSVKGNERSEDSKDYTDESEPWISLSYEPSESDIASKYRAHMTSNEGGPIDFTMSTSDYVLSLCPGAPTGSKRISRCHAVREMLSLPLEERLKKWFTEVAQVNRFDALMHLAPTYSEEDILKMLPSYADLVRGLWVCKSSSLFDDGYASKRDKILLQFIKKDSIPSKDIDRVIRSDDPRRNRILNPLCKERDKLKDYKFIAAADSSFIKRYPHIVKEQDDAWSVRETTMRDLQEALNNTEQRKTKSLTRSSIPSEGPDPNVSKARDGAVQGSDNNVHSVLCTVFTSNKVRSIQAVVRSLRQLAAKYASNRKDGSKFQALSDAAKACASYPQRELVASISLVAAPVHDVFVAKPPVKDHLRSVLITLFRNGEPNGKLSKQEILDFAEKHLKRKITEKEYHQAVTEICITTEEGHLVLKNGDKP